MTMDRENRRHFLRGALGTVTSAALPLAFAEADEWNQFRSRLKGRAIFPADAGYDAARRVFFWNPETERRPAVVVRCGDADDIRYAVDFARKHSLELSVRGGGHSPLGWGVSNGMVLDMTGMNRISIDPAKRIATVDAGVLGGELMRAAGQYGLAPIVGQCPGVGVAGVTLGGGLGWLAGVHGASCDHLISARIVTADARIIKADHDESPELLWGLRGAGANFGVAASLECRLHPIDSVTAGDIYYPGQHARAVLRFFEDFMAGAPDTFQATLNLTKGDRGVFISLCHSGDEAEASRLLRVLRAAAPSKDTVKRQKFADLAARAPVAAAGANFRCTANVYRTELSNDVMEKVLDRLGDAPAEAIIGVSHYMHGAVCRVKPESAAFPLRQQGGIHFRVGMDWNAPGDSQRLMKWAGDARALLRPAAEQIYANYQSVEGKGTGQAVFGANHARLAALKTKYDPSNFFHRNSNVRPA